MKSTDLDSWVSAFVTAEAREASLVLGAGEDAPETAGREWLLQQLPVSAGRQLTQGVLFLTQEHRKHFTLLLHRQHQRGREEAATVASEVHTKCRRRK